MKLNEMKKAGRNLNAFSRILPYKNFEKRRMFINFFLRHSWFLPLLFLLVFTIVRMFCSRKMNNKINHLQERCLRIVCSDKTSSFGKLLETDRSVPIHIRNLQALSVGLSKEIKDLTPTIFSDFFFKIQSAQYILRHASEFSVPNLKSTLTASNRK